MRKGNHNQAAQIAQLLFRLYIVVKLTPTDTIFPSSPFPHCAFRHIVHLPCSPAATFPASVPFPAPNPEPAPDRMMPWPADTMRPI